MSMKYIIVLLSIIALMGCKKRVAHPSKAEVIYVDVNAPTPSLDISPFLRDDVDIVALETNDSCLVSQILKIEFYRGDIFLSDRTSQLIYRFNSAGKFINRIGKVGKGPGEYVTLGDFTIVDGSVYVQDPDLDKIFIYDIDNRFVNTFTPSPQIYFDEFMNIDGKLYFITNYRGSDTENCIVYEMDLSSNKINGFLPYDESIIYGAGEAKKWGLKKYSSKYDRSALFIYSNCDTIYSINDRSITPKYEVKFSERKLPAEEIEKGGTHAMITAMDKGYILGMESINDSENFLFFSYPDGNKVRDVTYDKANKKCYVSEWLLVESLGNLYGTNYFTYNNEFVIVQDAYLFKDLWERQYNKAGFKKEENREKMSGVYHRINEDDNPVLFRFKFKNNN